MNSKRPVFAALALGAVVVVPLFIGACGGGEAKIAWSCTGTTKNSMQCEIKNTGAAPGEACFDIVQICGGGEHIANVCTGRVEPGSVSAKVVPSFSPSVGIFETCKGTEFRNTHITVAQ